MAPRITKIICLVLLCALLAGCQYSQLQLPEAAALSASIPAAAATEPTATEPAATAPQLLPPGTGAVVQAPVTQQPILASVKIPALDAANAFVYDCESEEFLYISGEADTALYPASTTKLFTTYVALQYLSPEDTVKVGKELTYVVWDAATAGFLQGDKVSVETLVYAALLPSGCDASYILAAAAGRVILNDRNATAKAAITAFMDECNRTAGKLGMENTHLVTPDGYHAEEHRISLQAFAIIGRCCLENSLIAKVVTTTEITVSYTRSGKTCTLLLRNTNKTIRPDSEYYNTLSVGLKTGFTDEAGHCLLTAYRVDGRYILVGVFGCSASAKRFQDSNQLLNAYLPYL